MSAPANATRDQILALLREGRSTAYIARELRVDKGRVRRIRNAENLPVYVSGSEQPTLEERWRQHAIPTTDGHMEWTGERGNYGRPLVSYQYRHHSAAGIAFRIRTGRNPVGHVLADCGIKHCIAPDHVLDADERRRTREQLRYLQGRQPLRETCQNGHEQVVHARIGTDGIAYCFPCKQDRQARARNAGSAA